MLTTTRDRFPRWAGASIIIAAILVSIPLHAWLGMDSSWDTANYHLYIGWAAVTGHFYDLGAVAQYRTYLNPVLDVFNYLAFSRSAYAGAALHSVVFAANAWLVFLLASRVCGDGPYARFASVLAVAIGMSGAMTVSLMGTWTNEHQTALFVLAGFLLVLQGLETGRVGRVLAAGFCVGAALGLKLSALTFAIGIFATVAVGAGRQFRFTWQFCIGAALGFILVEAPFMYLRWEATGNPVFPFFNNVFKSPNFPPVWNPETWGTIGGFDAARTMRQFALPYKWLTEGLTSEAPSVRDGRFLLASVGLAFAAIGLAMRRGLKRDHLLLLVFFVTSFAAWNVLFHRYRYLVAIEMLTGLVFVAGCQLLVRNWNRFAIGAATAAVVLFLGFVTVYPDWGRRFWEPEFARSNLTSLPEARRASTIYVADQRLSYLAPLLQAGGIRFANLYSQPWWDGARHSTVEDDDTSTDVGSRLDDTSDRIAILQNSEADVRAKSRFLAERFRGKTFSCVPVWTSMIWNTFLCSFGNPPGK